MKNSWTKIAITNRQLCDGSLVDQIDKIGGGAQQPDALILREKDLTQAEYQALAQTVMQRCEHFGIDCILHTYLAVAKQLQCGRIHLPLAVLLAEQENLAQFEVVGASVHSVQEAVAAQNAGAHYITAGHIFATDCKKGVQPRGVEFLKAVCEAVTIPVYAIGGMQLERLPQMEALGAAGICVMSGYMR